jgi:hypothetical protein
MRPLSSWMHVQPAFESVTSVIPWESADAVSPPFGASGDAEPPNACGSAPANLLDGNVCAEGAVGAVPAQATANTQHAAVAMALMFPFITNLLSAWLVRLPSPIQEACRE